MAEYSRVMERNADRQIAALTETDRAFYAEEFDAISNEQIKRSMLGFSLTGGQVGNEKSALFARLLHGKAALPLPPPTSFSRPWYSLIEEPGPHKASMVSVRSSAPDQLPRGGELTIAINQCAWLVTQSNESGMRLMALNDELQQRDTANGEGDGYRWTPEFLARVKAAYTSGPEFVVQFGEWPAYRLFVTQKGQSDDCDKAQRRYAREKIKGEFNLTQLRHTDTVFDLMRLAFNGRIGKTLRKGVHPQVRLDEAKKRYATLLASHAQTKEPMPFTALFDQQLIDRQFAELEQEVRDFEADPDCNDWVEFFTDRWYLERISC